ncbi:MAG: helix-turn-helix domain-containing protein, partial [Prevotella sp.]|nr:helix-turn-helix domain-containing protein [Prevotella sp.]
IFIYFFVHLQIKQANMKENEQSELEQLRQKVEELTAQNKHLQEANEQLIARNMMLGEKLDIYYEVRSRVQWLKELVRKHRELVAQADLRDDEELLAVIEAQLEGDNIPLPPEFSVKEVAELVGTTQSRIIDLYKKKTIYHSVDKYLDFLRLMRALRMLKDNPNYSIEAIAHDAGFNTVRTLNRKIQESLGITPGVFRDITNPN